jgi:hypothetical protein
MGPSKISRMLLRRRVGHGDLAGRRKVIEVGLLPTAGVPVPRGSFLNRQRLESCWFSVEAGGEKVLSVVG